MLLGSHGNFVRFTALVCTALLAPGEALLMAQQDAPPSAEAPAEQSAPLPPEQLDSLVAPIALYPDDLLAQVLAASTYPLEIVQLQQWLAKHKDLKDKQLAEAVQKEKWDPSVQGLAGLPDVVKQLADNIKWTSELGNAFLAQQSDVMDSVQRMRAKASDNGKLKSSEQVKVEKKVVESKTVVVIEQANPQVVYVPSYDPVVVYGAPPPMYAYPPMVYPPGYYAAGMALSFGVGVAMGAMWSGGWGYHCGWGGNNTININNNNNFNRNSARVNGGNRGQGGTRPGGGNTWQHNPQHRGGAPYGDRATAKQYGGTARGEGRGTRQASASQGLAQRGGAGGAGASSFRSSGAGAGGAGSRGSGGGDRVGNRQVSSGGGSKSSGAFSGASRGGSSARASSSRGSSSYGGSRGGGGRGGGGRRR